MRSGTVTAPPAASAVTDAPADDSSDGTDHTRSTDIGLPPDLTFSAPDDGASTVPAPTVQEPRTPEMTLSTQTPSPVPPAGHDRHVDPARLLASLTRPGQRQASATDWKARPAYALTAVLDPDSGRVDARLNAKVPIGNDADRRWWEEAHGDDDIPD